MRRTDVTYGQLDKVLRSLGFTVRPGFNDPPGRIYEHKSAGAIIMLPAVSESDRVFEYHLAAVRTELDNFGLANPTVFAAKLQNVEQAISSNKNGDKVSTCNKLDAFINEVNAEVQGGRLTQAQAAPLIAAANRIKAVLGCA